MIEFIIVILDPGDRHGGGTPHDIQILLSLLNHSKGNKGGSLGISGDIIMIQLNFDIVKDFSGIDASCYENGSNKDQDAP